MFGSVGMGTALSVENGSLTVRLDTPGCGGCAMSCRTDGLITAVNLCDARAGDRVHIVEDESFILTLQLIQFGLPLIFFLTGLIAFYYIYQSELTSLATAVTGLIVGGAVSRFILKRVTRNRKPAYMAKGRLA